VTTLYTLSYVALAVIHLITYLAIVARHAIPRAPRAFHAALTAPMLSGVVLLFVIAAAVAGDLRDVFGLDISYYRLAFLWTEIAWLSVLLYYAFWWFKHGRNEEG
jgi:hypothetical protein